MGTSLRACMAAVFLLVTTHGLRAQNGAGSVRLTGQVSGAVSVSVAEASAEGEGAQVSTADVDASTVVVNISGSGEEAARVRLPVRLRSNVGYSLRASFLSPDALAVRVSIAEVKATGRFVNEKAVEAAGLLRTPAAERALRAPLLTVRNQPLPFAVLSGPAVSKAGTFTSPDNALEVVLIVELRGQSGGQAWKTRLTLSAAPGS